MADTQTIRTSDFISSIGVNAHIDSVSSSYGTSDVARQMAFLGIDEMRVSTPYDNLAAYTALGEDGMKFDIIPVVAHQNPVNLSSETGLIDSVAPYVQYVEGPNEINTDPITYNGLSGAAAADAFQEDLYASVHSDPALSGALVLPFSLSVGGSLTGYGDVTAYADIGNVHGYASDGVPPTYMLGYAVSSVTTVTGKPVIMSETGNYTLMDGNSGVTQDVQAKWLMDSLLENSASGVLKTYLYQLEDGGTDQPGAVPDPENHYGLYNADGTPKQAATDIHNLTSILSDKGAAAATFSPGTLDYSATGMPYYAQQTVFAKSDGSFDIALWSEPRFFDSQTGVTSAVTPSAVNIALSGRYDISVFDPVTGTATVSTRFGAGSVDLSLGTDPLIVEVRRSAPVQPVLVSQAQDQRLGAGAGFSFTLPPASFSDADGGTVALAVTGLDGAPLPSWISYDPGTGVFSGTTLATGGTQGVMVTATTSEGQVSAEAFHIYTASDAPVLAAQQNDQRYLCGQAFSFTLPDASFTAPAGEGVSYSASRLDGTPLPSWLSFDAATGTFSGTAPSSAGAQSVLVTASTTGGGASAEAFKILTSAAPPVLAVQDQDQRLSAGSAFSFGLAHGDFTDPAGLPLTYSASSTDGSAVPSWVAFDPSELTLSGTVPDGKTSQGIVITATAADGGVSSEAFRIYGAPAAPDFIAQTQDERLAAGTPFSFEITPPFAAPDGGSVSLFAGSADLSSLASWVSFNPATDVFSGTTPSGSGSTGIRIDGTTPSGGTAAEAFHIYYGVPGVSRSAVAGAA